MQMKILLKFLLPQQINCKIIRNTKISNGHAHDTREMLTNIRKASGTATGVIFVATVDRRGLFFSVKISGSKHEEGAIVRFFA